MYPRRTFLKTAATAALATSASAAGPAGFPRLDLHVHLDNSTIDAVLALPHVAGTRLGIVEHAGTKENVYPTVLSDDRELDAYLAMLAGKGVWRGVQTEYSDWQQGFSRAALRRLDFILTDAMTFPGKDGRRVKLWEPNVEARVEMADRQSFMDRYVDWHVAILEEQPIDLLANVSWLPAPLLDDYDRYWTTPRIERVVRAASRRGVALEISSSYKLPRRRFLEAAAAAGVQFAFGSNGRYPKMARLDYSLEMAAALKLRPADIFVPGRKPKRIDA